MDKLYIPLISNKFFHLGFDILFGYIYVNEIVLSKDYLTIAKIVLYHKKTKLKENKERMFLYMKICQKHSLFLDHSGNYRHLISLFKSHFEFFNDFISRAYDLIYMSIIKRYVINALTRQFPVYDSHHQLKTTFLPIYFFISCWDLRC